MLIAVVQPSDVDLWLAPRSRASRCVDSASEVNDRKAGVRLVQFLVDSAQYAALRRRAGARSTRQLSKPAAARRL